MLYGIDFVVAVNQQYLVNTKYNGNKTEMTCDCWVCDGKGKVGIDFTKNVFNCVKCSQNKGTFYDLHMSLQNRYAGKQLTRLTAREELDYMYNSLSEEEKTDYMANLQKIKQMPEPVPVLPIAKRNAVYSRQIEVLELAEEDYKNLHDKRKMPDSLIEKAGYKTTPVICADTLGEYIVCSSDAVKVEEGGDATPYYHHWFKNGSPLPGYYLDEDGAIAMVSRKPAIMVPIRWRHGEVSLFQLRYRNLPDNATEEQKAHFTKYAWFASGEKKNGRKVTGAEQIHHTFTTDSENEVTPEEVAITEGAMKADIASYYWNMPFLAIAGVNNLKQVPDEFAWLKDHGTKNIKVAMDKDWMINPNVCRGMINIIQMAIDAGLSADLCVWGEERKGIDDLLIDYGPSSIVCRHIDAQIWDSSAKKWLTNVLNKLQETKYPAAA